MKLGFIEKIGSVGSFVAALACPACFPLFAVVGGALGLKILFPFEGITIIIFKILVLLALIGNVISYSNHKNRIVLIVGIICPVMIFISFYIYWNPIILYIGLFGLLVSSVLNAIARRRCKMCSINEEK